MTTPGPIATAPDDVRDAARLAYIDNEGYGSRAGFDAAADVAYAAGLAAAADTAFAATTTCHPHRGGPVTTRADILDIAQPWLAVCGACDARLPQTCQHPAGDYRVVMQALAEEVRRARAEAADYADALDSIACAVETATDDTLRDGIRSMIRRARPEALKLWQDRVISTINQRDKTERQR